MSRVALTSYSPNVPEGQCSFRKSARSEGWLTLHSIDHEAMVLRLIRRLAKIEPSRKSRPRRGWDYLAHGARSAFRNHLLPSRTLNVLGFRLVCRYALIH
jgi:hypothetical protein